MKLFIYVSYCDFGTWKHIFSALPFGAMQHFLPPSSRRATQPAAESESYFSAARKLALAPSAIQALPPKHSFLDGSGEISVTRRIF